MEVLAVIFSLISLASALKINSIAGDDAVVLYTAEGPNCLAPRDVGDGLGQEEAWHYSELEGRCVFFIYSGSGGNSNRFSSRDKCEAVCEPFRCPELDCPDTCSRTKDHNGCDVCACTKMEASELCVEPTQRGYCRALHNKWAWSPSEGRCVPFVYGGCGGNQNNFDEEINCLRVCRGF